MAQPFVHLELNTPNLTQSKDFYGKLFGWSIQDVPMGPGMTYSLFKPDTGPGGGMMSMPGVPHQWLAYVGVPDIHTATQQAASLGATIIRPPQEIPGEGWMSVLLDPGSVPIALFQSSRA